MSIKLIAKNNEFCEVSLKGCLQYFAQVDDGHSGCDNGFVVVLPVEQGKELYDFMEKYGANEFVLDNGLTYEQVKDYKRIGIQPNKDENPDFYVIEFKLAEAAGDTDGKSSTIIEVNGTVITINNID